MDSILPELLTTIVAVLIDDAITNYVDYSWEIKKTFVDDSDEDTIEFLESSAMILEDSVQSIDASHKTPEMVNFISRTYPVLFQKSFKAERQLRAIRIMENLEDLKQRLLVNRMWKDCFSKASKRVDIDYILYPPLSCKRKLFHELTDDVDELPSTETVH